MDASAVAAIVEEHLERLKAALAITHWHTDVHVGRHEGTGSPGVCERENADYSQVEIWIDPAQHATPEGVLETLVHELIHVVLAPIQHYRNVVTQLLPDDAAQRVEGVAATHMEEQIVVLLERGLARELRKLPEPEVENA